MYFFFFFNRTICVGGWEIKPWEWDQINSGGIAATKVKQTGIV